MADEATSVAPETSPAPTETPAVDPVEQQARELAAHTKAEYEKNSGSEKKLTTRDERGRFASAQANSEPDDSTDTGEPGKRELPDDVNPDEYEKARNALLRDEHTPDYLDTLDPKELIERGNKRAKVQADVDALGNKIKQLQEQLDNRSVAGTKDTTTDEPSDGDLKKLVEPIANLLGDDEVSEQLESFAREIINRSQRGESEAEARAAKLEKQLIDLQRNDARSRLEKKYDLTDTDRWKQVVEARDADKNKHASEADAIEAACRLLFADEMLARAEARAAQKRAAKDNGTPTTVSNATQNLAPKTPQAFNELAARKAIRGDTKGIEELKQKRDEYHES